MKTLTILCVLVLTTTSAFSLSAKNAQLMAALEQLESLLSNQLLSEVVQEQAYDDLAAKEELIAALQRACNRGSGAHTQSLSALANLLSRDEVTAQEAMNYIQSQGLYELVAEQGLPTDPPKEVEKVIEKVAEDKIKDDIKKEVEKETEKEVEKEVEKEIVKKVAGSPLFARRLRHFLENGTPAPPAVPPPKPAPAVSKVIAANPGGLLGLIRSLLDANVVAQYYD